jgi:hypothetical protein
VRKLVTWLVVTLGIAAIVRRLRRRAPQTEIPAPPREGDPADELRQKLAASRAASGGSPTTTEASAEEPSVEARRAEVHDHGRSTLDEMRADET